MNKIKVGILGATGFVGHRFVQLLENHPYFELTSLAASDKSVDTEYMGIKIQKMLLFLGVLQKAQFSMQWNLSNANSSR